MTMQRWIGALAMCGALVACAGNQGKQPKHASGDNFQFGALGAHRTMDDATADEEAAEAKAEEPPPQP